MSDNEGFDGIFKNPMKKKSADEISETIAKALSDLIGQKLEVDIKSIDFSPEGGSLLNTTRIELNVQKPLKEKLNNI